MGTICAISGNGEAYVGRTETYTLKCYQGGRRVDCATNANPNTVTWVDSYHKVERGGDSITINYDAEPPAGTTKVEAIWHSPAGDINCGSMNVVVKIPSCMGYI